MTDRRLGAPLSALDAPPPTAADRPGRTRRGARALGARALAAPALLLLAGCPRGGATPAPAATRPPLTVLVAPVREESIQRTIVLYGTLHGDEEATVSNRVVGRVRSIAADVGDVVSGGAVLAALETEDFELGLLAARRALESILARLSVTAVPDEGFSVERVASVVRARAELENAQAKLARLVALGQKDTSFVTEQALKDAETNVAVGAATLEAERFAAQANVAEARQKQAEVGLAARRLADATLRAPESERRWSVTARLVSAGEYLKEGTAVFRVVASDPLTLRGAAPQKHAAELRVGQQVAVRVEGYGVRTFPATIARINPSVDVTNRTFGVEVRVPNPNGELLPGSFASGEVLTRREPALLVPMDAVVSFAGVQKVFVLEDGKARGRIVTVGDRSGSDVEVRGVGLAPGVNVLVRGQTAVADGTAVVVSGSAPPAAPSAPARSGS